jgi:hypothetical protein
MRLALTALTLSLAAGGAAAQSGCVAVAAEADGQLRAMGTPEAARVADALGELDTAVILQVYADVAREVAQDLDRGRGVTPQDAALLDNLTGMVDCFVGDETAPVFINSVTMPFAERFDGANRMALLEAVERQDATAPVIGCIRGGLC